MADAGGGDAHALPRAAHVCRDGNVGLSPLVFIRGGGFSKNVAFTAEFK